MVNGVYNICFICILTQAITLYVAQDNRAVNLYQRQGYTIAEDTDGCLYTWCAVGIRVSKQTHMQALAHIISQVKVSRHHVN